MSGLKRITMPLLVGVAVFLAGFGAMSLFWILGTLPENLPGFWDYRSATIGDGVLLPIIAGVLVVLIRDWPKAKYEKLMAAAATLLGCITGIYLQHLWLNDPTIELNWTVPAPHTFNIPGWYHAGFLVAASAFFAALVALLFVRVVSGRQTNPQTFQSMLGSHAFSVLVACILGFIGLVVLDNRESFSTLSRMSTLTATGLIAGLAVIGIAVIARRQLSHILPGLVSAVLLAAGVILVGWQMSNILTVFEASHCAIAIAAIVMVLLVCLPASTLRSKMWIATAPLVLLSGFALCLANAGNRLGISLALVGLLVALIYIGTDVQDIQHRTRGDPRKHELVVASLAIFVAITALVVESWMSQARDPSLPKADMQSGFVWIFLPLLTGLGMWRYGHLIHDEAELPPGFTLEQSFFRTWLTVILIVVSAVIVSLQLIYAPGSAFSLDLPTAISTGFPPTLVIGFSLSLLLIFATFFTEQPEPKDGRVPRWTEETTIDIGPKTLMLVGLAMVIWAIAPWFVSAQIHAPLSFGATGIYRMSVYFVIGLVVAIWGGYTTAESIWGDVAYQEFYRLGRKALLLCTACGLANMSILIWLWFAGSWSAGDWAPIGSIILKLLMLYLGGAILYALCALRVAKAIAPIPDGPDYVSLHHPASNVFHDSLTQDFSFILTLLVIVLVDRVMRSFDTNTTGYMMLIVIIVPMISILVPAYLSTKVHTEKHLGSEAARAPSAAMSSRAGDEDVMAMNQERVNRIALRMKRNFFVAFAISPFGWMTHGYRFILRRAAYEK